MRELPRLEFAAFAETDDKNATHAQIGCTGRMEERDFVVFALMLAVGERCSDDAAELRIDVGGCAFEFFIGEDWDHKGTGGNAPRQVTRNRYLHAAVVCAGRSEALADGSRD
jgi:hypothetical protein